MPKLTIIIPGAGETVYDLEEGVNSLGRLPDNTIQIEDSSVSGHHAEIVVEGDKVTLRDLGSTNGTLVNRKDAKEEVITADDAIVFGSVPASLQPVGEAPGSKPLPASGGDSEPIVEPATRTMRPPGFQNESPYAKPGLTLDGPSKGILALAGLSILAMAGVLFLVFTQLGA